MIRIETLEESVEFAEGSADPLWSLREPTTGDVIATLDGDMTPEEQEAYAKQLASMPEAIHAMLSMITKEIDLRRRSPLFVKAVKGLRASVGEKS